MDWLNQALFAAKDLSVAGVALNLILGTFLSLVLGWHFRRFGSTFSNRRKFARILIPITLTTVLIISVVKASLALSLGLVGALSIVRFRTPVKEPEELAYLFMAIAAGLGLGADHRAVTVCAMLMILAVLALVASLRGGARGASMYLDLEIPDGGGVTLEELLDPVARHAKDVDLRRLDIDGGTLHATFWLDCEDSSKLSALRGEIGRRFPGASVSFVEHSGMPGG